MPLLDWLVIIVYLLAMLVLAWYLGRTQQSRTDYYLASNNLPPWALSTSILATQCSTNSLLGAPAFVGFVAGGGMLWLQYELAVPLAMLVLCFLFLPIRRAGVISIYEFLEQRLGKESRLLASGCFLFFRGVATGVTVYGVASIIELITGVSYLQAALLLMAVTIVYDLMGGMRAVVISDVVQMLLLVGAILLALLFLLDPLVAHFGDLEERRVALANDWGIQSGNNYGFWPMLIGGLFLYTAYYGCDQSQAQRLLSANSDADTQRILALNGVLRFPLVLAYCFLGLGLAAYAIEHTSFIEGLPKTESGTPNFNLVFPAFVQLEFAPGLAGLTIVGLFAAAMSSIDSALNSLSASTVEDFWAKYRKQGSGSERELFLVSKIATGAWGLFALLFSFQVERIAPTVLEAINKIGSMVNGPLLALFVIALFFRHFGQRAAIVGFSIGVVGNLLASVGLENMSWLWWNPLGFFVAMISACVFVLVSGRSVTLPQFINIQVPGKILVLLLSMTICILFVCVTISA